MTTNQEARHQDLRDQTSTAGSASSDWHAYWDNEGVAAGTWNERMLTWVNTALGTSYTNVTGAMHAFAVDRGFTSWGALGEIVNAVATPVFSPAAGGYVTSQNVTITCSTPSSTIYYTTDGSTPTVLSSVYSTPVAISANTTLKAFATAAGLDDSAVQTGVYTISDGIAVAATVLTPTTADITISDVEVDNGTFYMVVISSAGAAPSAAQVEAGTDASDVAAPWSDSKSVLDTNDVTVEAFGLSTVEYKAYAVQKDSAGGYTAVAVSSAFTPADVTAPVLSSAEGTKTGSSTADLSVTTDSGEGTLWWVVTTSATTPSAAQIKAGQDHTSSAAADTNGPTGTTVTASGPQTPSASGLSDATEYWAHFVQDDASANTSNTITSSASFTTDSATVIIESIIDGTATGVTVDFSTVTENYSDPDGGNNAILLTNTNTSMRFYDALTFADGVNKISITAKHVASSTSTRWMRIRPGNVTDTRTSHVNVINGSFSATHASNDGQNVIDEGNGWYTFEVTLDLTGDADLNGIIQFWPADADNDTSVPTSDGSEQIAVYRLKVELVP